MRTVFPQRRLAIAAAAASLATLLAHGTADAAGTAFVFLTDNNPVSADIYAAILARMGPDTILDVFTPRNTDPTREAKLLNGTRIQFNGNISRNVGGTLLERYTAARFNVMGDLSLGPEDRIYAFGSNLLSIQVANNATLATGSVIDLSAAGTLGGAGGGAGGTAYAPATLFTPANDSNLIGFGATRPIPGPPGFIAGGSGRGGGGGGFSRIYDPAESFAAIAGGNGQNGVGDYRSRGGPGGVGTPPELIGIPTAPRMPSSPGGDAAFSTIAKGANGTSAPNGVTGVAGTAGGHAGSVGFGREVSLPTLRGGSGGGAGGTGGHGFPGQDGGAGGGGAATLLLSSCTLFCPPTPTGTFEGGTGGGTSGLGGYGGKGGQGGNGGGGGGGVELLVRGNLDVQRGAVFKATGADGAAGSSGVTGQAGQAGGQSKVPDTNFFGQTGGRGGNGGNGGAGGTGGPGGTGAGGSGGSIQLIAASLYLDQSHIDVSGGGPNPVQGDFLTESFAGPGSRRSGLDSFSLLGANPYVSFNDGNAFTPNIIDLRGGAEPYGVLLSKQKVNGWTAALAGAPHVVGVIERSGSNVQRWVGRSAARYDMDQLTLTAVKPMKAPALSAVAVQDLAYPAPQIPAGPVPLRTRGFAANPDFTAGAAGFTDMPVLSGETFVVLTDRATDQGNFKVYDFQVAYTPYGRQRQFNGKPNDNGVLFITDNGLLRARLQVVSSSHLPVVLHDSTSETTANLRSSTYARTNGTAQLRITGSNAGHEGSLMPGRLSVDSNVRGLLANDVYELRTAGGTTEVQSIVQLKGVSGSTERIRAIFSNTFDDQGPTIWAYTYDLTYVTPVPSVNLAQNASREYVLDFGELTVGDTRSLSFQIGNTATPIAATQLDDLTLLYQMLSGSDSSAFSMLDGPSLVTVAAGASLSRSLKFTPDHAGSFSALYLITSDYNSDYGGQGDVFSFRLTGSAVTAVPEPGSMLLFGLGLAALLPMMRRRLVRT